MLNFGRGCLAYGANLVHSSHTVPRGIFWEDWRPRKCDERLSLLVPDERIELPTNGLQNRTSAGTRTYSKPDPACSLKSSASRT
jgi:hypothetical protein